MHGLRKEIHGHGSHWTERGAVDSVGWRSAETGDEFIQVSRLDPLNSIHNKPIGTHSTKLFMAALALQATYTSLLRCSALLIARMTLESAINLVSFQSETSLRFRRAFDSRKPARGGSTMAVTLDDTMELRMFGNMSSAFPQWNSTLVRPSSANTCRISGFIRTWHFHIFCPSYRSGLR